MSRSLYSSLPPIPIGSQNWGSALNDWLIEIKADAASLEDQIIALRERIEQLEIEFYEEKEGSGLAMVEDDE